MPAIKATHWREPLLVDVLKALNDIAHQQEAEFCVIGATARNLILEGVHGRAADAAVTRDVDFAIAVDNWEHYDRFRSALLETGDFEADPKNQHLLRHRLPSGASYPLDVIPFGGVVDDKQRLLWPPDYQVVMVRTSNRSPLTSPLATC
ncbi:MAG: hypothetical protein QM639_01620 [Rhodocyclaceae bacterium]